MFVSSRTNLHTCTLPLAGSRSPLVKYARGSHIGFSSTSQTRSCALRMPRYVTFTLFFGKQSVTYKRVINLFHNLYFFDFPHHWLTNYRSILSWDDTFSKVSKDQSSYPLVHPLWISFLYGASTQLTSQSVLD